jgi:mannosyltransferase OCH1-like enzyme
LSRLSTPQSLGIAVAAVVVVTVAIAVALVYAPHGGPCTPLQPREPLGAIPEQLFMTGPWPEDALPGPIRDSVESWRRHGPPGLRIHWFDEPAREAWVAKYFPQYLDAYRSLVPGAYQADLWRVLVLFAHGGVYSDAGTLLQEPLWTAMRGCSLVFSRDLGPKNISQGVLGAVQGHPVLINVAKAIAANVAKKYYGENGLCPTGPVLYGDVFRAWFKSQTLPIANPASGVWSLGKHNRNKVLLFDGSAAFDTETNGARKLLWQSKVPGYHKVMYNNRGVKQYGALWTERAIYRDVEPTTAAIPARLFMTGPFPAGRLPRKFANNVATWKRLGPPGFTVHWFDDTAAEQWIAANFPQYLSEYQVLVPGAFKADLWRLLVLYKYGGLYSDAGVYPMQSLWPMFRDASLVIVADGNPRNIWQGIIGAVAHHPIIFAMIEYVVANVRARRYMEDMLSVTGPRAVAFAARRALGHKSPMLGSDGEWLPGHYGPTGLVLAHKPPLRLFTAGSELFGHTKIPGYAHDMYTARQKLHYGTLWMARQIYSDHRRAASDIPHRLFMTGPFAVDALPPALAANLKAWKRYGPPDLDIQWFDDAAARAWIETHFPQFLDDYDVLVPGAFKADLWRLLVLHKHGGLYADAGTSPLTPIWPLFYEASLVFCRDTQENGGIKDIWQGVLAASAEHPVIWAMLTHVVNNIRGRQYGSHYLSVTGPKAVSAAAKAALRPSHSHLLAENDGEAWVTGDHGDVVIWSFSPGAIHTKDGQHIIQTKVPRYNDIMYKNRGVPKYSKLWKQKAIFNTPHGGDDLTDGASDDKNTGLCNLPTTVVVTDQGHAFDEMTACPQKLSLDALPKMSPSAREAIKTLVVLQNPSLVVQALSLLPNTSRVIVWNTEQMSRDTVLEQFCAQWRALDDHMKASSLAVDTCIWDYSHYNARMIQKQLTGLDVRVEVQPTASTDDVNRLKQLRKQTAPQYDYVCLGSGSPHRDAVVAAIRAKGRTVNCVQNLRGDNRDKAVARGRVLLNIHYNDTYRVFESIRCARWLAAGMPVESEACVNDDERVAAGASLLHI